MVQLHALSRSFSHSTFVAMSLIFLPITYANAERPARCQSTQATVCIDCQNGVPPLTDSTVLGPSTQQISKISSIVSKSRIKAVVSEPSKGKFLVPADFAENSDPGQAATPMIDASGDQTCQTVRGYGFSMTESSTDNLNKLPKDKRREALETLFSPSKGNMNYVVLPLSSSDFNEPSRGDFSVCDCGTKTPDPKSYCFSPDRLASTLSILKEAQAINPDLRLMLKPWSPPPHMKKPGSANPENGYRGGEFDPQWSESLGKCLVESVKYVQSKGFKVQSVAVQNEPGLSLPYPSVYLTDDAHAKVLDVMNNGLKKVSPDTQLVIRGDNFIAANGAKATLEMMKTKPKNPVFAAHCYSNDPDSSRVLLPPGLDRFCSDKIPSGLEYAMGECTASGKPDFVGDFNWWLSNRVFLDSDMGAGTVMAWNGVLDEKHGPKNDGCSHCRGLLTTDFSSGTGKLSTNPEFYAINHVSLWARPNARRILNEASKGAPTHLVFRNPDGSTAVIVKNDKNETVNFDLYSSDCRRIPVTLPANGAATLLIN